MAAFRLYLPLILAAICLAILLDVLTSGCAADAGVKQEKVNVKEEKVNFNEEKVRVKKEKDNVKEENVRVKEEKVTSENDRPLLEEDDWKPIWDDLQLQHYVPSKTFEILNELQKTFDDVYVPLKDFAVKDQIDTLIRMWNMDETLCTDSGIKGLATDRYHDEWYSGSLRIYVKSLKNKFLEMCIRESLDNECIKSNSAVIRLAGYMRGAVARSKNEPVSDFRRYLRTLHNYPQEVVQSLIDYLREVAATTRNPNLKVDDAYEKYVIETCNCWLSVTNKARIVNGYFKESTEYEEMNFKSDIGDMCEYIYVNDEEIRGQLMKVKKRPMSPLFGATPKEERDVDSNKEATDGRRKRVKTEKP